MSAGGPAQGENVALIDLAQPAHVLPHFGNKILRCEFRLCVRKSLAGPHDTSVILAPLWGNQFGGDEILRDSIQGEDVRAERQKISTARTARKHQDQTTRSVCVRLAPVLDEKILLQSVCADHSRLNGNLRADFLRLAANA